MREFSRVGPYPTVVPKPVAKALSLLPQPAAELNARLKRNLDATLVYHSYFHTIDVINESLKLANEAGLNDRDISLITMAALGHDAGFMTHRNDNERIGAKMTETAMKLSKHYNTEEIETVVQMIIDTKLISEGPAQVSSTRLSPFLLDADLSNLGRSVFWSQTRAVAAELDIEFADFTSITAKLMERHDWQSDVGDRLYGVQKKKNYEELRTSLSKAESYWS